MRDLGFVGVLLLLWLSSAVAAADRRQTMPELGHPDQEILTQPKNPMIRDTSQLTDTDNMMIMRHLVQEPFVWTGSRFFITDKFIFIH